MDLKPRVRYARALHLGDVNGRQYSHTEIAKMLSVSAQTVHRWIDESVAEERRAICPLCGRRCIVMEPVRADRGDTYPMHLAKGERRQRYCEAGGWLVEDDEYVEAKTS